MTTTPVMTITDEQIAEIEAQCLKCEQQGGAVLMRSDSLSVLISRLRSAEKDAARWRKCQTMPKTWWLEAMHEASMKDGRSLNAAIDAAMEQSK